MEQDYIQSLVISPFMKAGNIEVLDNMRLGESERNLEGPYMAIRSKILTPPFNKVTSVAVLAPAATAKGRLIQGIMEVAEADDEMMESLGEFGVAMDIVPVPFAMYAQAAKLERFRGNKDFYVPSHLKHGQYELAHYVNMSRLMQRDLNYLLKTSGKKAVLLLLEANSTAYPKVDPNSHGLRGEPVEIEGVDRCNSPIFNLALNPKTKNNFFLFGIKSNPEVTNYALALRANVGANAMDPYAIFKSDDVIMYTKDGEKVQLTLGSLDEQEQRILLDFLAGTMAPPLSIQRINSEYNNLKDKLYQEGRVKNKSDRTFFRTLRDTLSMPSNQAFFVANPTLSGQKTYHLDEFLSSLPARLYPELTADVREVLGLLPFDQSFLNHVSEAAYRVK